jgi:hypothetical protein
MEPAPPVSVARRVASADPAGLLYGAIISASGLAAVSLHTTSAARVAIATGAVLVIYWMADLYVHALSVRFEGDTRGLLLRLGHAARHKASVLKGGVPSIVAFLVVYAFSEDYSLAAFSGLGVAVVLLTVAGYLGARHAGTPERQAAIEGAGAGLLGVVIVVAKFLLH